MAKEFTPSDDALLAELGVEVEVKKVANRTAREERIIAGFEEVQRFVSEQGRNPQHGEERDIFERIYAVRLDRLRELPECCDLIEAIDTQGLLSNTGQTDQNDPDELDDDALLAELGIESAASPLTDLKHVRSTAEKKSADEIAQREKCNDFDVFKPLFDSVEKELKQGLRTSRVIRKDAGFLKSDIQVGDFYILGGQTLFIAEVGEPIKAPNGASDARMRVIYSNGTESNILLRSLQRAIYKDEASRMISEPTAGPLFSDQTINGDEESGTIYVLRSKSDHPIVAENRELVHKIGVTNMSVEKRIAGAETHPTFLMADVEIVATYTLYNINRSKLENLIHRIFETARLDIEIMDRFGKPVTPREWFLVPLFIIEEAIEKIKDGTISEVHYDANQAALLPY
ncbi:MAG: GIY-YIG nuclease family protein [Alphaproteobacteria bacterium]